VSDQNADTPRTTGSWQFFAETALSLVLRLRDCLVTWTSSNPLKRDRERATEAEALITKLQALEWRFRAWPDHPERAAKERPELWPQLAQLQREANDLMARKPRWWKR
jgi:hypothetical protein